MRSTSELAAMRSSLSSALCWPLLLSLHAEQDDRGDEVVTQSIFTIGWNADIPAFRVRPLLDELQAVGAITFEADEPDRMMRVEVL